MATITARTNDKVYSVAKWYGLNESPDGDTRLRMGEASTMTNWRITRDGNLKLRPGQEFLLALGVSYVADIDTDRLLVISTYEAEDTLYLANQISADAVPGKIVLVGGSAAIVERGVLILEDASIKNGVLNLPSTWTWNAETGDLENNSQAGVMVSAAEVPAILDALEEGTYKYIEHDGGVYALPNGGMAQDGDRYVLSGYPVLAVAQSTPSPVKSMWSGVMNGHDVFLAACNGMLCSLYDYEHDEFKRTDIGQINTSKGVHFFQFDGIVYILDGTKYYKYDGTNLTEITESNAYVPLVAIGIGPNDSADAGELTSEYVNKLTRKRRCWLSPNGVSGKTFQLPEKNLASIDSVKTTSGGTAVTCTKDTTNGTVTITSNYDAAVNSIEVIYTAASTTATTAMRNEVLNMRYSELYSGTTDTRIFLYGNGTNKTIYSGMDYDGMPRPDYFPDQYEVLVGDSNEPITAMIRHGGALICYKPRECWSLQHGVVELATGDLTPSIYCTPVNREKGNVAPGQVQLVDNSPVTVSGSELYRWGSVSRYSSAIGRDERNATRISDRIQSSIKEIDFKTCLMWDDNDNQEFYLCGDEMALVWNYAVDAWYRYENFDCSAICSFHGDLYVGSHDGRVRRMSNYVIGDEGFPIEARWESGSMDFGAPSMRKYSAALWVGMKPETGTGVDVTVITDRKDTFAEKTLSSEKAKIDGQPFMTRAKIKAKKFVFYKLRLSVHSKMLPVTVTNAEIRVRMTSDAK